MQPKKGKLSGTYKGKNEKIDIKLSLIAFEEGNNQIVYCPALDVSGYGKDDAEANESFTISLDSFFEYTLNKGTFVDELRRLGWKIKNIHKKMTPPDLSQLLSQNDNFSRIFNDYSFRKFDKEIEIPNV